jgi:ASC-1-like (ASCH) protein
MLTDLPLSSVLPGVPDVDAGVAVYDKFYTKGDQDRFGVVAIEIDSVHDAHRMSIPCICTCCS